MIKTKIVATVGPATSSENMLARMIEAGVNVFRLNFSHGTLDEHETALNTIRRLANENGTTVAVLGDLCGPKIRVGNVKDGRIELQIGQHIRIQRDEILGNDKRISSNYERLIEDVEKSHRVLIDDGNVLLRVIDKGPDELVCQCEIAGIVSDHKGINLPDSEVSTPTLTEKDETDARWAAEHQLDYLALSFVRDPNDLIQLRELLAQLDSDLPIVAKIEKPQAIAKLEQIIREADGIMVARGDLGVEMDVSRVPIIQKEIVLQCQRVGKPVIIATQMLQSMVDAPVPTRAEVSDVANAILDHTDAVMLSAETAVGKYPLHAVRMMRRIANETESFRTRRFRQHTTEDADGYQIESAVISGASLVARRLKTKLVAAWTRQGQAARLLSKHRMNQPLFAFTPNEAVSRRMALLYGVQPRWVRHEIEPLKELADLDQFLIYQGFAQEGDRILVVSDLRPDLPEEVDSLFIHIVGSGEASLNSQAP